MPRHTPAVQDYLKALQLVEWGDRDESDRVPTHALADRLGVSDASATNMLKKLAAMGLVEHAPYKGASLTGAGRKVALEVIRHHRLLETYLAEALGVPWDRVHDEAERLEHAVSDDLVDRMAATIGEPEVDPHGAPIPTRDGAVDETEYTSLADLPIGVPGMVVRVADEDPAMLRYLAELSVVPGKKVTVKSRAPFGGPITLTLGRQEISIGPGLAAHVLTAPVTEKAGGGKRG